MCFVGDVIDMVSKSFVTEIWMEVGRVNVSDQYWESVSTEFASFQDAVVFVSIPSEESNQSPLVSRVRSATSMGRVSFDVKLYHANDSYCSKEWFIPRSLSDTLEVSWMVVEKGAFNISGYYFMVGSGDITRVDNSNELYNFIRFNYPVGCETLTKSCRFEDGTLVGAINQIQSLVYDRFLTVRALVHGLGFSRFVLVPHDSDDLSYYNMSLAETLAYMAFDGSGVLDCSERISFEMGQFDSATSASTTILFDGSYEYPVSVFGMVSSAISMAASTSVRAWNMTSTFFQISLQEDQCTTEENIHLTEEVVSYIAVGELSQVTSSIVCKINFQYQHKNTSLSSTSPPSLQPTDFLSSVPPSEVSSPTPTLVPSSLPTTKPTYFPTSILPTGVPTVAPSMSMSPTGTIGT